MEIIHQGRHTDVYRTRMPDGRRVVAKALRGPHPDEEVRRAFLREIALTRRVVANSVIGVVSVDELGGLPRLLLEDFGGHSLAIAFRHARPEVPLVLRIARELTRALGAVHDAHVVHKDVNPSNIVWNAQTGRLALIDFGISTETTSEAGPSAAQHLEGTLAYLAPEQTGRLAARVDRRADYYALGATLYELLAGRPPFTEEDPLALLHAHLARAPEAPSKLDGRVPECVSQVVLKLLEKRPEDRYQSLEGLAHDLERCEAIVAGRQSADGFVVGAADASRDLALSRKLYGRDTEVRTLVRAARSAGKGALVFVAGTSGVGKTALIDTVWRELAAGRMRFARGKFEQFDRGEAYSAVCEALDGLGRQLLTEDDLDSLRHRLGEALGTHARALTELVPSLAHLLGRPAPLPALPPEDAERRLHRAINEFLRALSESGVPLTVVLDDLQWADGPSLRLLQGLQSALVLGTYRPEEVGADHPLTRIMASTPHELITLAPLSGRAAGLLIQDTLTPSAEPVEPLVQVALDKTQGNPFYLGRYLHALERSSVLRFDYPKGWTWDLEAAKAYAASENVVEFMAQSLEDLPEGSLRVLQAGAVIGDRFVVEDVAAIADLEVEAVREALVPAVQAELVSSQRGRDGGGIRFAHDRIRQAARLGIPEVQASALHAAMGRRLRGREDASPFDVAHHLNAGHASLTLAERQRLAGLNLHVGSKALAAVAFEPALAFFEAGLRDSSTPDQVRSLRFGAAESAYLAGKAVRARAAIGALLTDRSLTPLQAARALRIRMRLAVSQGELPRAVDAGIEALSVVGVELPPRASKLRVAADLAKTRLALRDRRPGERAQDPVLSDRVQNMAMELLAELAPPVYLARPEVLPLLGCAMARLAAQHGVGPLASYGYALYALVLSAIGDYETAAHYGDLADALGARFPDDRMTARRAQLLQGFVRHWSRPVRAGREPLARGFELAVDSGDFAWAAFCGQMHLILSFLGGVSLDLVRSEGRSYTDATEKLQQQHALAVNTCYLRASDYLLSRNPNAARLGDERALRKSLSEQKNHTGLFNFHFVRLFLAVLFDDDDARDAARMSARFLDAVPATYCVPVFLSLDVFATTRRWSELSLAERARASARMALSQQRLKRWAKRCPANHRSRSALVDAELARVAGRRGAALRAYDEAIEAAREQDHRFDAALAGEFAADYQQSLGNGRLADAYLAEAAYDYARWGAQRKVDALRALNPTLVPERASSPSTRGGTTTTTSKGLDLEAMAIVKVSRALSEHLVLDELVDALVRITLEISGGTRAVFLGPDGDVRATAATQDGRAAIPERVVQYVRRTAQDLLLPDAVETGLFREDPVVRSRRLRSVLCLPVQNQGELRALLYVEHAGLPNAFSSKQLEMLRLLTAQASISLENARLYTNLERSLEAQVQLTTAHARFVPHQFLQALERDQITDVALGDHAEKEMSILFSDIRGFTSIVEGLSPAENIAFINRYLAHMEPAIIENGGFVDSYIGDAIMALFDGPSDDAVRAGIAMQRGLHALNRERARRGEAPVQTGIGVNTGGLMLGTIGGSTNLKCGVIGDSVNLASRVESLTKHYGCAMLVSDHTRRRLNAPGQFSFRHIERIVPVGTSEPVTIYEVIDADTSKRADRKRKNLEEHAAAVEAYYERRFSVALGRFAAILERDPDDAAAQRFIERCTGYLRTGVPDDWDGVVRMKTK